VKKRNESGFEKLVDRVCVGRLYFSGHEGE